MTRLILIRHGESKGNAKRVFLGHTNWDVTEKGRGKIRCHKVKGHGAETFVQGIQNSCNEEVM